MKPEVTTMHLKLPILLAASALAVLLSSCGSPQIALRRAEPAAAVQPTSAYPELGYSYWTPAFRSVL